MYLTQGLHRALQRGPDRILLTHLGATPAADHTGSPPAPEARSHRCDAVLAGVAQRAAALAAQGVRAGDRVALLGGNDDRLVLALYACWWLGAVACPLNVRAAPPEWAQALADAEPTLLLVDEALAPRLPEAVHSQAGLRAVLGLDAFAAQADTSEPIPDSRTGNEALAALLYTGGTTGRAKGVMLTHANLWSASIARAAELPNPPEGVSLLVAPLFHVAGLGRLIGQTIAGAPCVTMAAFRPDAALAAIERLGIGDIIVVPTMLQALLDDPAFEAARVQSLQRIAFGAAPMPPDLLDRALAAWPQAEFFQAYGLTETAGAVCINLPANHRSPAAREAGLLRSVGRAGLGAEIRIVDPADPAGPALPPGTVGEIVCRGPMVTPGYWRQPATTAAAFAEGWFRTGDAGHMRADGSLFIVDRLKDMIISGGENVYCAEVEAVLREHPAVAQAAVVGLPDARWGEVVHAFVVARGPLDAAELQAWCRARLAGYKCPRSCSFVAELPLSAAGKVLKNRLRDKARAEAADGRNAPADRA